MRNRRHLLGLALLALSCSACGEPQPAEPTAKTVPLGLILAGVGIATLVLLTRWAWRRIDHGSPLRYPRGTAALVLAPTLLGGGVLVLGLTGTLALGYRQEQISMLSWEDWLVLTLVVGGFALAVHMIAALISMAVTGSTASGRFVGQVALGLLVAGLGLYGIGLAYFPALVASFIRDREPSEARLGAPTPVPRVDRPPAGCRGG